jgi:hypothetical protein
MAPKQSRRLHEEKETVMILKHRERGTVEFVLEQEAARTPHLVGSWDDWRLPGVPMVRQPGEAPTWMVEVPLSPGEHQFRYRIGDDWSNDPSADRYVDNGLGGHNSVVIVEEVPKKAVRRSSPERAATKQRTRQSGASKDSK